MLRDIYRGVSIRWILWNDTGDMKNMTVGIPTWNVSSYRRVAWQS